MAYFMPSEEGLTYKVTDALEDLLTLECKTEIDTEDLSYAGIVKVGRIQDEPTLVNVLIHESFHLSPQQWTHGPLRFPAASTRGGTLSDEMADIERLRTTTGRMTIGQQRVNSRAFTVEIQIWGNMAPETTLTRRQVAHLGSVVESRVIRTLVNAQYAIGTGGQIEDDFGEFVTDGPFFGDFWTQREEGESLRIQKFIQFWYRTGLRRPT